MSAEENKALVRLFYDDVINRGELSVVDKVIASNFVEHTPQPGQASGVQGVKQWFMVLRNAFPDARATAEDMIVEGDKVVTRVKFSGTHKGEFMGIPPTGKRFTIEGFDMIRVSGGKVVEHWGIVDNLGMMQQLGVVQPPGTPRK